MLVEYFLLLILGYFLFRLIFNLILPIIRSTRVIRQGFARMQEEMNPGQDAPGPKPSRPPHAGQHPGRNPSPNWVKMGDYIDFVEVK
jgi:hypothetical protein